MNPKATEPNKAITIDNIKIPTDSSKGTPEKDETVCSLWVFQNCGGEKEKKLRRIVSLVRTRNSIDWLPVTTDGNICIVTYLGEFSNLIKLRSSVFGLGMESFSFSPNRYWVIPPNDLAQFNNFFEIIKSDLQAREKRFLQQREREIKDKTISVKTSDFGESEEVDLNEKDIDDLRKELEAITSI
ncbi:MAG TPA: hypothetical protein VMZ29_08240 [Candidatus Bathyarchaeia archaeon]|nr:hypothetical protein [Candidatus Bathyarchaeia archaeon]